MIEGKPKCRGPIVKVIVARTTRMESWLLGQLEALRQRTEDSVNAIVAENSNRLRQLNWMVLSWGFKLSAISSGLSRILA
jgi:hypothetical protein